mmetsp:Transcript_9637/g.31957  ORF Transcript_9637/g.31957 Transcript_9637/m.31957 type:complete len:270 (-) Transcript_9637:150-959(-)
MLSNRGALQRDEWERRAPRTCPSTEHAPNNPKAVLTHWRRSLPLSLPLSLSFSLFLSLSAPPCPSARRKLSNHWATLARLVPEYRHRAVGGGGHAAGKSAYLAPAAVSFSSASVATTRSFSTAFAASAAAASAAAGALFCARLVSRHPSLAGGGSGVVGEVRVGAFGCAAGVDSVGCSSTSTSSASSSWTGRTFCAATAASAAGAAAAVAACAAVGLQRPAAWTSAAATASLAAASRRPRDRFGRSAGGAALPLLLGAPAARRVAARGG